MHIGAERRSTSGTPPAQRPYCDAMTIPVASTKPPLRLPVTVTVIPVRIALVLVVFEPLITGVFPAALTIVKSSMRKLMSRPSGPPRVRFTTGPVTVVDGLSGGAVGGVVGGVVGGSVGGVVGGVVGFSLTGGPG